MPYYSSAYNAGSTGQVLTSQGAGVAPQWAAASAQSWGLTGNAGTSPSTNFIGTADNVSLRFRTNNTAKMIIDSMGNVGIGTTSPKSVLDVAGTDVSPLTSGIQVSTPTYPQYIFNATGGALMQKYGG